MARGGIDLIGRRDGFWQTPALQDAIARRDIAQLFRLVQRVTGASQTQIGIATGRSQAQVSGIMSGRRRVTSIDVLARVVAGLAMPDDLAATLFLGRPPADAAGRVPGKAVPDPRPHANAASDLPGEPAEGPVEEPWQIERRRTWLASLYVDEAKLAYLESAAQSAIADNERRPPRQLAPLVRQLRGHVDAMLRGHQHPPHRARLYAVAVYLSGLLGALALDLGRLDPARAYARESFELAHAADSAPLQSWARATQSLVEYYAGNYHDSLAFARDGQRLAAGGAHSVRLAVNGEARALARIGDRHGVDEAVGRGFEHLDHAPAESAVSPSLSTGRYCLTRANANAATAYLALGLAPKADGYAQQALPEFDRAGLHGPQALTRLDLATALLLQDSPEPEQATELVRQALDVTDDERFGSVAQRAREFVTAGQRWSRTPAMQEIIDLVAQRTAAQPVPYPSNST